MADFPAIKNSEGKPFSLNGKTLILLLLLFLIFKLAEQFTVANFSVRASDLSPENILNSINQQRSLRNLILLNTDSRLTGAAAYKAQDMIDRKYFAHIDPDGNYIWPKIVAEGYVPYSQLGENLAIEFYDTDSLIAAWMNSPTHRANILQENFRDQGMGLSFGDSASGQYHSSIANTFGALLPSKNSSLAPPAETPTIIKTPKPPAIAPKTPTVKPVAPPKPAPPAPVPLPPVEKPNPAPVPVQASASPEAANQTGENPVKAREGLNVLAQNTFKTTPGNTTTPPLVPSKSLPLALPSPNLEDNLKPFQLTHYFTLAFGLVLLIFLASDARKIAKSKLESLNKKMSNLALLFISLIVIAFMYWL